jgi:hypothetical protein
VQLGIEQRNVRDCFAKQQKGIFALKLYRGLEFNRVAPVAQHSVEDSPLYDPLAAIGFDGVSIRRILKQYPAKLIQLWADITLAAVEQGRVKDAPPAFFQYYIRRAAERRSTPPDWWREIERRRRNEEDEQRRARNGLRFTTESELSFEQYLEGEAHDVFQRVMHQLKADLVKVGRSDGEAESFAKEQTLVHFRNKFRHERGGESAWSRVVPTRT